MTPVIGRWYPPKVRRAVMYVNDPDWEVKQSCKCCKFMVMHFRVSSC